MKILNVFIFLFFFVHLTANPPGNNDHSVSQRISGIKNDTVSLEGFFSDTLRNDSFFRNNFARYSLVIKQIDVDSDKGSSFQNPVPKKAYRRDWVFLVVVESLVLLLFIKFNFTKLYKNALFSFYKRSATAELINDKYSPRWLFVFCSNLFFVLVITLWAYRNFVILDPPLYAERPAVFWEIFGLFLIVYAVKFFLHLFMGALFQVSDAIIIYIINISITNLVCGIVMLFVTLLLLFSPWQGQRWLINVSFGVLIIFIILRYLRGLMQTARYFKYNYLYLILYLCTLEIAPWFLIIRYLNKFL